MGSHTERLWAVQARWALAKSWSWPQAHLLEFYFRTIYKGNFEQEVRFLNFSINRIRNIKNTDLSSKHNVKCYGANVNWFEYNYTVWPLSLSFLVIDSMMLPRQRHQISSGLFRFVFFFFFWTLSFGDWLFGGTEYMMMTQDGAFLPCPSCLRLASHASQTVSKAPMRLTCLLFSTEDWHGGLSFRMLLVFGILQWCTYLSSPVLSMVYQVWCTCSCAPYTLQPLWTLCNRKHCNAKERRLVCICER